MKRIYLSLIIIVTFVLVGACTKNTENNNSNPDSNTNQLVFQAQIVKLTMGENVVCYIVSKEDIGYGGKPTLISLNIPEEELYDAKDNLIELKELREGNVLEITSDGAFLESYPLQLGNVFKVKVIEDGSLEDIQQYQEEFSEYLSLAE